MSEPYCPPFTVLLSYLFLILISIGGVAFILRELAEGAELPPMSYFFILGFVSIIIICSFIIGQMLFPKQAILPPPEL